MIEISATEHLNTETAGKTLNFLDAGTTWSKILTVEITYRYILTKYK